MPRRSYGTGSLYVRADSAGRETWYGRWRRDGQQHKRAIGAKRQAGSSSGLTRAQAEAELRRLMAEDARPRIGERHELSAVADRYLAHLETSGRKRSTIAAVRGHLDHWIVPFLGEKAIDKVRSEDVVDLVVLMQNGTRPSGLSRTKPLAAKTIVNAIGTLHALFEFARRRKWATSNPVVEVELPRAVASDDIRFLTPAEVDAAAAGALAGDYQAIDRALIVTAAMTGLRQGELIALRWRDVDWPAARIRVRQNHVLGEFDTPKSRRGSRSVPMADRVASELERLFQVSRAQEDDDLVFADPLIGGPLSKRSVLLRFRQALKGAHLDDTHRFHDLRHTFGTQMAAVGVSMRTLQEWMGHRDIQTTQRYADYAPSAHEARFIAAAFDATTPAAEELPALVPGTPELAPGRAP